MKAQSSITAFLRAAARFVFAVMLTHSVNNTASAESQVFTVQAEQSHVRVHLFKKGLFKGFGHEHDLEWTRWNGTVTLDWQNLSAGAVELRFEAASVVERNLELDEDDRHEVEETTRGAEVLDTASQPEIRFHSTKVAVQSQDASVAKLQVTGELTVRGIVHTITAPVEVKLVDGVLQATGTAEFKQTDFGITPISAGLGTVKVKDELRVDLELRAVQKVP